MQLIAQLILFFELNLFLDYWLHATLGVHFCLELKLILLSTFQLGSSLHIFSTLQYHIFLVSDRSQTPFTLKMKRKFPVNRPITF